MNKSNHISLLHSNANFETQENISKLRPPEDTDLVLWWRTVPGARRFINTVADAVDKHCSCSAHLPESDTFGFVQLLEEKLRKRHVSLIVETFKYSGEGDAEDFANALTEKYAPNFFRDFTEDSPIADLSKQNIFEGYAIIVWLEKKYDWLHSAAPDFNRCTSDSGGSLIFVTSEKNPPPGLIRLSDCLTPYDVQFFAINMLDRANLTARQKLYTSTLAAKLSGQSVILAKNLARPELFNDPENFLKNLLPQSDEKIFYRALWECQVQFLMPTLEEIRGRLIEKNFVALKNLLPVEDEFGNEIKDPFDMELRHLRHYGGRAMIFKQNDWDVLELAYQARNELSHLKTIDLARVEKIFAFAD